MNGKKADCQSNEQEISISEATIDEVKEIEALLKEIWSPMIQKIFGMHDRAFREFPKKG